MMMYKCHPIQYYDFSSLDLCIASHDADFLNQNITLISGNKRLMI